MLKPAVLFVGLAMAGLSLSPSAHAQGIHIGPGGVRIDPGVRPGLERGMVGTREATRIARRYGMSEVDTVTRSGNRLRVDGADRRGRDMRVVIHGRTGDVLDVSRGRF